MKWQKKKLSDPEVLEKSRELDSVLNEYHRLLKKTMGAD